MKYGQEELLRDLYNLILNPGTRDFERQQLQKVKQEVAAGRNWNSIIASLEADLRPLASRNNLTPDVADFYAKLRGQTIEKFNFARHAAADLPYQDRAIFAGGCFWCMVEPFENQQGIVSVLSGYTGGKTSYPTYDQVLSGQTGHVEAVEIIYDTRVVSYAELVSLYWQLTDPTDAGGQINDRGAHYRPVFCP